MRYSFLNMETWARWLVRHCLICKQSLEDALFICQTCEQRLPWINAGCAICGLSLPKHLTLCKKCQSFSQPYFKLYCIFYYRWPLTQWIKGLKFNQQLYFGLILGRYLKAHIPKWYPNKTYPRVIVPVPLSLKRQRRRGYNQIDEVLRLIADFPIPIRRDLCRRIKETKPQARLPISQKEQNLAGAFRLTKPVAYSHIALLDDVVTTQATIQSLARTFLHAGVSRIDVWSLCRAEDWS